MGLKTRLSAHLLNNTPNCFSHLHLHLHLISFLSLLVNWLAGLTKGPRPISASVNH